MEKKTIGRLLAELRKESGMTQQEVANRLHVSNKSVSRWERDESAPDLTLIPIIAELFGVSCDELLTGKKTERISAKAVIPTHDQAVAHYPISQTVFRFQAHCVVAIALAVVGLVCMLGISYGFYLPMVGFAVMLLSEIASFVLTVISVGKIKEELREVSDIDPCLIERFYTALGNFSFIAFFAELAVLLLSLPLICFESSYIFSVLGVNDYSIFVVMITLFLVLVFLVVKKPYTDWITGQPHLESARNNPRVHLMNRLQLGSLLLGLISFVVAPYLDFHESSLIYTALEILGLIFLCADVICFIVFIRKYRSDRQELMITGIRNILLIPSVLALTVIPSITYTDDGIGAWKREVIWNLQDILLSFGWIWLVAVAFCIVKRQLLKNRTHKRK